MADLSVLFDEKRRKALQSMIKNGVRIEFRGRPPLAESLYDWLASSRNPPVMVDEGGFAFYRKGMVLSDSDKLPDGKREGDPK